MILLQAEGLSKTHGDRVIFQNVGLTINSGDKIGLIGRNGSGKSTLLKLLVGLGESEAGKITTSRELRLEYLLQESDFVEDETVLAQIFRGTSPLMQVVRDYEEALAAATADPEDEAAIARLLLMNEQMDQADAWQLESEAKAVLGKLGIQDVHAQISTLSGGMRKRVALAGALIRPANLLVLDEPTNHLDNETIRDLEEILKERNTALLVVTHDRYFLERVTSTILELAQGHIYRYEGNYSYFIEQKALREERENRMQEKAHSLYRQELLWMRKGVEARRTKQKARRERFYALEEGLGSQQNEKLQISVGGARLGKKIIEIDHLGKAFGEKRCLADLSYAMVRDDRIGIVGANGLGKSTLLNILAGLDQDHTGQVDIGETVRIGYYTQDNRPLNEAQKVIDYIRDKGEYITQADGSKITAARMLEQFLFSGGMQHQPIAKLSGGEKRRLYLLGVLMEDANVLLLDEPTNDLDIDTLQVLEDYLEAFPGPVLIVSHDRYFLDKTCEQIWAFYSGGRIDRHTGNYSEYLAKAAPLPAATLPGRGKAIDDRSQAPQKVRFTYHEAKEYEHIEDDIAALERRLEEISEAMTAHASDFVQLAALQKEQDQLEATLLEKMDRWSYLADIDQQMQEK